MIFLDSGAFFLNQVDWFVLHFPVLTRPDHALPDRTGPDPPSDRTGPDRILFWAVVRRILRTKAQQEDYLVVQDTGNYFTRMCAFTWM